MSGRPGLAAVLASAAGLRLAWLAYAQPVPVSDAAHYLNWARQLLAHGQFGHPEPTAYTLPGYPAFLALLWWLHDSVAWLQLAQVGLAVLTAWLVARLAGRLFPGRPRVALLAAAVYALYPSFVFSAPLFLSENLFTPLMLATLLVALGPWPGLPAAAAAGLLLGAAMYVRGETAVYAPVVFFIFLLDRGRAGERLPRRAAAALVVFLVTVAAITPWLLRNQAVMGAAGLTTNSGLSLYLGNNPHGYNNVHHTPDAPRHLGEVERNRAARRAALEYLSAHPERIPLLVARKTYHLLRPTRMPVYWASRAEHRAGSEQGGYPAKDLPGLRLWEWVCALGWVGLAGLCLAFPWSLGMWNRRAGWVVGAMLAGNWLLYGVVFVGLARYRYFLEVMLCLVAATVLARWLPGRGPLAGRGGLRD